MKGFLNHEQIEYVLFHLGQHITISKAIRDSFVFIKEGENPSAFPGKIIFILSEKEISEDSVIFIGDLPILAPIKNYNKVFEVLGKSLVFTTDLLKSSFYLLSGYQERGIPKPDPLGRFGFESSIQYKKEFLTRPVVNYYFEEIIRGISVFCSENNLECRRNEAFRNFCFFFTHDVDRIRYFNLNSMLYIVKQIAGFAESEKNKQWLVKELVRICLNSLNFSPKNDPYWNFDYMVGLESELSIHSTWFFLPKDQKHVDSYYKLNDRKIRKLIGMLRGKGHEIGLHGTVRSHDSAKAMGQIKELLLQATGEKETGIRQHRLMWKHPGTALIQESSGLVYDSTLGFAGHEGFRNSYCFPFRLFDFENNRMIEIWEIPLIIMESTLFDYRQLSYQDAEASIVSLVSEVNKFGGVFSILWHNSYLHEYLRPGINSFYSQIIQSIMKKEPESLTGLEIIKRMKTANYGKRSYI